MSFLRNTSLGIRKGLVEVLKSENNSKLLFLYGERVKKQVLNLLKT